MRYTKRWHRCAFKNSSPACHNKGGAILRGAVASLAVFGLGASAWQSQGRSRRRQCRVDPAVTCNRRNVPPCRLLVPCRASAPDDHFGTWKDESDEATAPPLTETNGAGSPTVDTRTLTAATDNLPADAWREISMQLSLVQKQLSMQQMQINQMLQLMKRGTADTSHGELVSTAPTAVAQSSGHNNQSSFANVPTASVSTNTVPLRVMVFIDGTWLYYSLFERGDRCSIARQYGGNWFRRYRFDWEALPRIISQAVQDPWTPEGNQRPVEITRMSTFTSYKADTSEFSLRYRLFQELRAAGYDVHQMETVGSAEKCVDIQLAVEMVHFATVPNAYDVAVLLSGDKDFLPALIRVRQKGRKVAIVSMKAGVNRALYETDGVKDYDMVFLDDYLDQLLVRKETADVTSQTILHPFVIARLIWEFVQVSGCAEVSSRDVGRFLKSVRHGGTTLLDEIKQEYRSLRFFLMGSGLFRTGTVETSSDDIEDDSFGFNVILRNEEPDNLHQAYNRANLSTQEKDTLQRLLRQIPTDKQTAYFFTYARNGTEAEKTSVPDIQENDSSPADLLVDYTLLTVPKLRECCRERGLSTKGLKADLIARIQKDVNETIEKVQNNPKTQLEEYLIGIVQEYLTACGGGASSRDVGRYLAANKCTIPGSSQKMTAGSAMKQSFGGLAAFVASHSTLFDMGSVNDGGPGGGDYSYHISLKG